LDTDPTPGEAWTVRGLARTWTQVADEAERAQAGVRSLAGDGALLEWIGAAADAFRPAIGELPGQLSKCATSYRAGADALTAWAGDLEHDQAQADKALVLGREARERIRALQAQLDGALDQVSTTQARADHLSHPGAGAPAPDADQVRSATRAAMAAAAHRDAVASQLADAHAEWEAARSLALDAQELRRGHAATTARRIHDAAEAGIAPNSFWDDVKEVAAQTWDVLVVIAKVIVVVLGIVALIIGGPLAWVVFAASLVLLADALMRWRQGKASLWEVALAALGCIPGVKGLTTLAELRAAFAAGGALAAGAHVLGAGRTAITSMAAALRTLPTDAGAAIRIGGATFAEARAAVNGWEVPLRIPAWAQLADGSTMLMLADRTAQIPNLAGLARAAGGALREGSSSFGSIRSAQLVANADGSYDVVFRYNKNWDEFRRLNADAKAEGLTDAGVSMPERATPRDPSNTARWARENPVSDPSSWHATEFRDGYSFDVDHLRDLQVGGDDASNNMWWLESRVNRSEGAQLAGALRRTSIVPGAEFNTFTFTERGVDGLTLFDVTGHLIRPATAIG